MTGFENIILQLAVIFAGAAIFATLFLFLKQPIILAYIALGMAIGPLGSGIILNAEHIERLSRVGIILLLFLIGLNLRPDRLYKLFGKISIITLATSIIFLLLGMIVTLLSGFSLKESLIIGAALMFSSTIVGLKLIPTTALHHKHTGELMVSVLLLQDIIAIIIILIISGGQAENVTMTALLLLLKLVLMSTGAFLIVRYAITALFIRFDTIREYSFLLSLGWGLLSAGVAHLLGLSYALGAFVAGVSLATVPIALIIAEDLKPLRDFFLILFFFSIGASFDFLLTQHILLTSLFLTLVLMLAKPFAFKLGFHMMGEKEPLAAELGVRLGQASEFSLLVAYSALLSGHIGQQASYLIQSVVILTFIFSTYWVVLKYPTPISSQAGKRQD